MTRRCLPMVAASLLALFVMTVPEIADAQVTSVPARSTARQWSVDLAGTAGVIPGIGAMTTGLDLTGAVSFVRSVEPGEFTHRCVGLTTVFTSVTSRSAADRVSPREQSVLIGPRWDSGGPDGSGFVRLIGGVRRVSGLRPEASGLQKFSKIVPGVGVGFGVEVLGVVLDMNVVLSPWDDDAPTRLTFAVGYIWSFPFRD